MGRPRKNANKQLPGQQPMPAVEPVIEQDKAAFDAAVKAAVEADRKAREGLEIPKVEKGKSSSFMMKAKKIEADLKRAQLEKKELLRRNALKDAEVLKKLVEQEGSDDDKLSYLRWARARKIISKGDSYKLNKIEAEILIDSCEYVQKINGGIGSYLELGQEVRYSKSYDASKECDMYTFYAVVTKSPEDQETKDIEWKRRNGVMVTPEDFAPEYDQYHRFELRESEFLKYFNPYEE